MIPRRLVLNVVVAEELLALRRCREIVVRLRQQERVREAWGKEGGERHVRHNNGRHAVRCRTKMGRTN